MQQQIMLGLKAGAPPASFPVLQSVANTKFTVAGSFAVPMPATVNSGDLLLMFCTCASPINLPSGWTSHVNVQDSGGSGYYMRLMSKVAAGTEGGTTVSVSITGGDEFSVVVVRISGAAAASYISTATAYIASSSGTPATVNASWGSNNNLFLFFSGAYYLNAPTGYPMPDNNNAYITNSPAQYFASRQLAAGSLAPGAFTFSSTQYGGMITAVIRPA